DADIAPQRLHRHLGGGGCFQGHVNQPFLGKEPRRGKTGGSNRNSTRDQKLAPRNFVGNSVVHRFAPDSVSYFGMGTDTALPAPRSAIQIVSRTGSTPVGVSSPSLITVTVALSPFTVRAEILPLAFSAT